MASEPAKCGGLTTGSLIDAYFEEQYMWDINTKSKFAQTPCVRFVEHSEFRIVQQTNSAKL